MSEDMAFSNEEIGELIEFLRKEGLDPCDDAADLIEAQSAEISALRERVKELENHIEKVNQMRIDLPTFPSQYKAWFIEGMALLSTRREEG